MFSNPSSICGGALVRSNFVLTSAHCINEAVDIVLRFGIIDRLEGPTSAIFRITSRDHIIVHPDFSYTTHANDIALLYLEGAETLLSEQYVDVIELPNAADADYSFVGLAGNATGFGLLDDEDPPLLSLLLQYVTMPIISSDDCQQAHGNSIYIEDKFCTDTTQGSTCRRDEGAPFVAEVNGRRVLAGIGSVSVTSCTVGWPAIFTSLLPHLDWIEDNVDEPPAGGTTTTRPPSSDKCNCVCHCITCPPTTPAKESFQKRWMEK
jgi:secreted trypsin-like serine protease